MYMCNATGFRSSRFGVVKTARTAATALALVFAAIMVMSAAAQAQLQVLHTFTGPDGALPKAGLTMDRGGKLYGTTWAGHEGTGWGGVFQLREHNGFWTFASLHIFDGQPLDRVVFGPNGTLYGTSPSNLVSYYYGYIFNLTPPLNVCEVVNCYYNGTVIYGFGGGTSGSTPQGADLIFDSAGNMYGTTKAGGNGNGVVYQLTESDGTWTENVIYTFNGSPDGSAPYSGVIFDPAGNLYGVTTAGGATGNGAVYELSPNGQGGWNEQVIYNFQGTTDGSYPAGGLVFDQSGNLYGTAANGGANGGGTVFELSPSNGSWTFTLLNSFAGTGTNCGPWALLSFDTSGNLYGTTLCDGANGDGNIWELAHSGNNWTYSSLYDFTGGNDGKRPYSNVTFDASGNLYGTASVGGADSLGTVWEFSPPRRH
jgi:uncharacterized repeat protein (TIGR03803 family)